ncbi:hypothetical protein OIO90_002279 [Microbotryomycetes sp. JL221]|nr:hypothetical protein OIO90_002279 [Microbotryomycetes sp. JL221]
MSQTEVVARDSSRSMLLGLLAITPMYMYSTQAKAKLGLDALHIGLFQVLVLLVLGQLSNWSPKKALTAPVRVITQAEQAVTSNGSATTNDETTSKPSSNKRRRNKSKKRSSKTVNDSTQHHLFKPSMCDRVVRNFLAATEPEYVKLLPPPTEQDRQLDAQQKAPDAMPLSDWKELFRDDTSLNLIVRQHPTANKLFALEAKFPNVPVRNLFEVLTTIDKRKEYDGMTQDTKEIERFEIVDQAPNGINDHGGKREIKGAAVWLAMKGMGPIKSKDMVLLSVAGRLPVPVPQDVKQVNVESNQDKMRMYCATTSFDHPDYPPQSGFNRMQMGVTGFLIEEDGQGGSNIVQVTDLSGLGSWVPGAVIRTVTQTMLPKSLYKLGKVAAAFDLDSMSRYSRDGQDWIPPLLGADDPKAIEKVKATGVDARGDGGEDEDDDDDDDDDDDASSVTLSEDDSDVNVNDKHALSASSSRALHNLVSQLKTVTSRLSALEQNNTSTTINNKKWYSSLIGMDQGVLSNGTVTTGTGGNIVLLTTVASAAGAAIAMAALRAWERRRN